MSVSQSFVRFFKKENSGQNSILDSFKIVHSCLHFWVEFYGLKKFQFLLLSSDKFSFYHFFGLNLQFKKYSKFCCCPVTKFRFCIFWVEFTVKQIPIFVVVKLQNFIFAFFWLNVH